MAPQPKRSSPLTHCREPGHRDLFMAVLQATESRQSTRQRQATRADELKGLYERHSQALKEDPGES